MTSRLRVLDWSPHHPIGAKGVGESATVGSADAPPSHPRTVPSLSTTPFDPVWPELGDRRHTTVASANGRRARVSSTAAASASASTVSTYPEAGADWIADHTRSGSSGMSMLRTPRCAIASITAFTYAAGEPTVADSPTPLAPIGWWGDQSKPAIVMSSVSLRVAQGAVIATCSM
jgi:hypothetical protein